MVTYVLYKGVRKKFHEGDWKLGIASIYQILFAQSTQPPSYTYIPPCLYPHQYSQSTKLPFLLYTLVNIPATKSPSSHTVFILTNNLPSLPKYCPWIPSSTFSVYQTILHTHLSLLSFYQLFWYIPVSLPVYQITTILTYPSYTFSVFHTQ